MIPTRRQWSYGVGITGTYSDFLHLSKRHSSSVIKGGQKVNL
ncbi:MAG: lactococcin 972 family bacteriocin [Breznakia sp.]